MSLINSLNSGISGLRSFQTKLDVVGNNISNVNTTGFKSRRVAFAEQLNQNRGRIGSNFETAPKVTNQVGLGVRVSSIDLDFSQGTLFDTNKPTDIALDGDGFFLVGEGNSNLRLTRAGNFSFNKNSELVTQNGLNVKGFNAREDGNIVTGRGLEDIRINFEDTFNPSQTQRVDLTGNLNANTSVAQRVQTLQAFTLRDGSIANGQDLVSDLAQASPGLDFAAGQTVNMTYNLNADASDAPQRTFALTLDDTTTLDGLAAQIENALNTDADANVDLGEANVFIEDGTLVVQSTQLGDSNLRLSLRSDTEGDIDFPTFNVEVTGKTNTVDISSTVYDTLGEDHTMITSFEQQANGDWNYTISFLDGATTEALNATPGVNTGTMTFDDAGNLTSDDAITVTFNPGTQASNVTYSLVFADGNQKLTQFDGSTTATVFNQDGFPKGDLVDFFIDSDGLIIGQYSNGKSKNLAQLSVSTVANAEGLISKGAGLYEITPQAGDLRVNTAANMADTTVNSGFLEGSNVDLTEQFTELIVTQRAFQSSARVIQTSDTILGETVQLKR